jgi:hypothetical protein
MRHTRIVAVGVLCIAIVAVACTDTTGTQGGDSTIVPEKCPLNVNQAWATEVDSAAVSVYLSQCPLLIYGDSQGFQSAPWFDVLFTRHGGTAGFMGTGKLWTINGGTSVQYVNQNFYFSDHAPYFYTHNDTTEQPLRGQMQLFTWYAHAVSGQRERDSLNVSYGTEKSYNNSWPDPNTAAAYAAVPVRRQVGSANILGPSGSLPGGSVSFRAKTMWDTSGYNFQWYVNGSGTASDTFATLARTFASIGTYTIRNDQILPDGTTLTSTKTFKVYNASISGPSNVKPFATCEWTASASGASSPYAYSWQAVSTTGTGQYFDFTNGVASGGSFTVQLAVTDASGAQVFVNKNVNVNSTAPNCVF